MSSREFFAQPPMSWWHNVWDNVCAAFGGFIGWCGQIFGYVADIEIADAISDAIDDVFDL